MEDEEELPEEEIEAAEKQPAVHNHGALDDEGCSSISAQATGLMLRTI